VTCVIEVEENVQLKEMVDAKSSDTVDTGHDDSCWQSDVDVIYDVDECPPVSLCLLLGFQVCRVIIEVA